MLKQIKIDRTKKKLIDYIKVMVVTFGSGGNVYYGVVDENGSRQSLIGIHHSHIVHIKYKTILYNSVRICEDTDSYKDIINEIIKKQHKLEKYNFSQW